MIRPKQNDRRYIENTMPGRQKDRRKKNLQPRTMVTTIQTLYKKIRKKYWTSN